MKLESLTNYPHLVSEWDWEKNNNIGLYPDQVKAGSNKKAYWKCLKNDRHEWKATIYNRTKLNSSCPNCSGMVATKGENDLATLYPELIKEWDWERNNNIGLYPDQVKAGSEKKAHWKCLKNDRHEWESSINNRAGKRKQGCPICSGRIVLTGDNDLATTHPELLKEWDWEKNNNIGLYPDQVSFGVNKKAHWKCLKDDRHEWESLINSRTRLKTNCPVCAGLKIVPGVNDLATTHPELIKEWDWEKNNNIGLYPDQVSPGTKKKAYWKCLKNKKHNWETPIINRTGKDKSGCFYCSNQRVLTGVNDLATTHPELLKEWDWEKNNNIGLYPNKISAGSEKRAYWKCSKNNYHIWKSYIYSRTGKNKNGCPFCSNSVSKGEIEIADFIRTFYNGEIITNDRKLLNGKELDIYLPDLKIAIEYNGLYWHSEVYKDKKYHLDKWEACQELGTQLITIWEDDWRDKQEIIKNMLKHKLGASTQETIYARKTVVEKIPYIEAKEFLENNHIQGYANGALKIGLKDTKNKLVALGIFKKNKNNSLNLVRYATSQKVVGGLGKILRAVQEFAPEISSIYTFADHEVSNGGIYEKLGFKIIKTIEPDYSYVYEGRRKHKFGFRLKRFKNDPKLDYEDGLTEKELAILNNITRVWDSGKIKYKLELSS